MPPSHRQGGREGIMKTQITSMEEMRDDICAQLTEHELAPDLGGDYAMNKAAADYFRGCEDWPDEKIRLEHAKLFEYEPDPPERSPEQMKRAAEVQERIDNYPRAKAWEVEELFEHAPDGDFCWDDQEADDWHVYCCGEKDCERQWHKVAYTLTLKRHAGRRKIEHHSVDEDGNWEIEDGWVEGEDNSWFFEMVANESNEFFKGWARYYLYCFHGGKDVLEQAREQSPEDWLKAAEKMIPTGN